LVSHSFLVAPEKSFSAINFINSGILTETGHPSTQRGFLHCRHLEASAIAISGVSPRGTSSKFLLLTSGSCSGIVARGTFIFFGFLSAIYSSIYTTIMVFFIVLYIFRRLPCYLFHHQDKRPDVCPVLQNQPYVHQIQVRPRRQILSRCRRILCSSRTCLFHPP